MEQQYAVLHCTGVHQVGHAEKRRSCGHSVLNQRWNDGVNAVEQRSARSVNGGALPVETPVLMSELYAFQLTHPLKP